jgi:hypothetical protein
VGQSKISKKQVQKYLLLGVGVQQIMLWLSLTGIGYSILKYLFVSVDTFQDLTVSAMYQPLYYSPNLVDDFSQPIGPPLILYYRLLRLAVPSLKVESISEAPFLPVLFYLITLVSIFFFLLFKLCGNRKIAFLLGISYPVLFLIGRGNPDILCLILFSVALLLKEKNRKVAAVLIGLLAAIKLPFAILAMIFLFKKEYKLLIIVLASLVLNFFAPLATTGYGIRNQTMKFTQVTQNYFNDYVLNDGGNLFNNSLYGFFKSIVLIVNRNRYFVPNELVDFRESIYFMVSLLVYVLISVPLIVFILTSKEKRFNPRKSENEIMLILVLLLIITPQVSAQYRLVFLLPVIAVLYQSESALIQDRQILLLFTFLLIPKEFIFVTFQNNQFAPITFSSLINGPLMYGLVCRSLYLIRTSQVPIKKKSAQVPSKKNYKKN